MEFPFGCRICDGTKVPQDVLTDQIRMYKTVFKEACDQVNKLDTAVGKFLGTTGGNNNPPPPGPGGGGPPVGRHSPPNNNPPPPSNFHGRGQPRPPPPPSYGGYGGDFGGDDNDDDNNMPPPPPRGGGRGRRARGSSTSTRTRGRGKGRARGRGSVNNGEINAGITNPNHVSRARGRARSRGGFNNFSGSSNSYHSTTTGSRGRGQTWNSGGGSGSDTVGEFPLSDSEDGNDNGGVKCHCNKQAIILTVKKEGPNQGRLFYKCGTCNFFQWCD